MTLFAVQVLTAATVGTAMNTAGADHEPRTRSPKSEKFKTHKPDDKSQDKNEQANNTNSGGSQWMDDFGGHSYVGPSPNHLVVMPGDPVTPFTPDGGHQSTEWGSAGNTPHSGAASASLPCSKSLAIAAASAGSRHDTHAANELNGTWTDGTVCLTDRETRLLTMLCNTIADTEDCRRAVRAAAMAVMADGTSMEQASEAVRKAMERHGP